MDAFENGKKKAETKYNGHNKKKTLTYVISINRIHSIVFTNFSTQCLLYLYKIKMGFFLPLILYYERTCVLYRMNCALILYTHMINILCKTHSPIYRFDWFSFFLLRVSSQNVISGWWLKRQMIFWLFFFSLHFPVELFELYKDFTITARFDALNRMALFMYDSYYQLVLRKITEWIAYSFMFKGTNGATLARHIKTYFNTLYIIVYI